MNTKKILRIKCAYAHFETCRKSNSDLRYERRVRKKISALYYENKILVDIVYM